MYAPLGRGLVFDNDIAGTSRQRIQGSRHQMQSRESGSRSGLGIASEASGNLVEASGQFRGSGSLSRAGLKGRIERTLEPDRGRESRGVRSAMEDNEDGGASLFRHQIINFAPAPAQPVI